MKTESTPKAPAAKNELHQKRHEKLVDLAYLARKFRLTHPRGSFDKGKRWYPDEDAEGGTPSVRSPSRAWPYSYMLACRTKKWCKQLPVRTLKADAAIAKAAIETGQLVRDESGRWEEASVLITEPVLIGK